MRLLNVFTLQFKVIIGKDIPKYVVASHRWRIEEEATLTDIASRRNLDKSGYKKVEGFAKYVREQLKHIDWLWIDTCCVDQTSSQEVTEIFDSTRTLNCVWLI